MIGEIIKDGQNGLLAPCELQYNWLGVPTVQENQEAFTSLVMKAIRTPVLLDQLRQRTGEGHANQAVKVLSNCGGVVQQ